MAGNAGMMTGPGTNTYLLGEDEIAVLDPGPDEAAHLESILSAAGAAIRWYVDPQSGHILKETYQTMSQNGPVAGETDMDGWKTMGGLTIPSVRHNKQNGQDSSTAEYTALELNPKIDPKLFDKPAASASQP